MFSQSFAFLEDSINNPQQLPPQPLQPKKPKAPKPPKQAKLKSRGTDLSESSENHHGGGGLFKTSLFGTTKRPSTSGGVKPKNPSEHPTDDSSPIPGQLARQTSFRGRFNSTPTTTTTTPTPTTTTNFPPEKQNSSAHSIRSIPLTDDADLPSPLLEQRDTEPRASVGIRPQEAAIAAHSTTRQDSHTPQPVPVPTPLPNMLARPGTSYSTFGATGGPGVVPPSLPSPTLENITYLHIQETSSKRISTLDYLRKAHEGRVYWFNTLLFNKPDLQRMPYFDSRKLARRATNYLLLGLSLPTVLDLNSSTPTEFLKTLNALLTEFESFQSIHPPDGSSSLSRARFPQMFKRATTSAGKGRRTSSAAEIGLPMGNDSHDSKMTNGTGSGGANSATSFLMGETDLLPGEEYTHLLTPSLPFDPDFYETFATLCDVLIDCYTRLMSLVSGPRECSPYIAEMFTKADARVRKILVQGVVKEFEDSSRAGVKGEISGVGKVVLGGLM